MAAKGKPAQRGGIRELRSIEKHYLGLRAKAGKLRRDEIALLRRLDKLVRRGKTSHLMTLEHRPGRKDKVTYHRSTGSQSRTALARARGSGLFCGCRVIIIRPQPNGDIDVCILIDCSNDPATAGFRCHYYCSSLVATPVVGIARRAQRRRRSR